LNTHTATAGRPRTRNVTTRAAARRQRADGETGTPLTDGARQAPRRLLRRRTRAFPHSTAGVGRRELDLRVTDALVDLCGQRVGLHVLPVDVDLVPPELTHTRACLQCERPAQAQSAVLGH